MLRLVKESTGAYFFNNINTVRCPDVDEVTYNSALTTGRIGTDGNFSEDVVTHIPGEFFEIFQGDDANVRRVVPGIGKLIIFWGDAFAEQLQANRIVAEVGETDDDLLVVGQPGQEVAVAAAEVENAAAGFDGRGDNPQIETDGVGVRQDHRKTL